MKTTKRIFACLLIVVMLASMLCVGASAADANITITGAEGTTYTAYKVLNIEATTNGSGDVVAILYTWVSDTLKTQADSTATTTTTPGGTYVTITDAAAFANAILVSPGAATAEKTITSGDTVTMTLADGYYVMKSSANTIPFAFTVCNGKIVTPSTGNETYIESTTIKEKTELPAVSKTSDKTAAYIGETIEYTTVITAKAGALNYILHDAAEDGITLDTSSIVVTKDSATVATTNYSVVTTPGDGCDFHIEFEQTFCDTLATGDEVKVTYTGVLNTEHAEISTDVNTNTTWLTHGATNNLRADATPVEVSTYQLIVNKTDGTNPLAGATFSLYTDSACATLAKFSGSGTEFTLDPEGTVTSFTTTASGAFTLKGLCGNYWLKETDAPDGYKINNEVTSVTIDENVETTITNTAGNPLPETGGMGTTVFYAAGGMLVLAALVVLLMKKRTVTE